MTVNTSWIALLALTLLAVACEGTLDCDVCGDDHATEAHSAATNGAEEPLATDAPPMVDDVLLDFVTDRRSDSFVRVNADAYPSDVSDSSINVFVSSFALTEYLETMPDSQTSPGKLPRGSFVVREIVDGDGEVTKLTAIYRGPRGYNPGSGDFWFAVTDPSGVPLQDGSGAEMVGALASCSSCHAARAEADFLFGVPDAFRDPAFEHPAQDQGEREPAAHQGPEDQPAPQPEGEPETQPEPSNAPAAVDLAGWSLVNHEEDLSRPQTGVLASVSVLPGTVVVVARNATRAAFEAFWGALPEDVVFVNQGGVGSFGAPIINGGEVWELRDADGQRRGELSPAGQANLSYTLGASSWIRREMSEATPGRTSAPVTTTRITEWSDAADYRMEFVEIIVAGD